MQSRTIERLLSALEQFVHSESAGARAAVSPVTFVWANSPWAPGYFALGERSLGTGFGDRRFEKPLLPWVNDGLMAFLFLVGLEIKREVFVGKLSAPRDAVPAVDAALGLLGRLASLEAG